jgi:hypothetical protein
MGIPYGASTRLVSAHYRDWPHWGFFRQRTERIKEKSPVTPTARSIQTKR